MNPVELSDLLIPGVAIVLAIMALNYFLPVESDDCTQDCNQGRNCSCGNKSKCSRKE